MEAGRFDDLIRALNGSLSRRRGLAAALGALVAGTAAAAEAKNQRGKGKGGPKPEGPCGDGSRKDNICAKDGDCCTGICKTGLKNKDGEGRCRCVRKGKECSEDKNCCGGRACVAGFCGASTPPVCDATNCPEGCCALGICVPYASQTSAGCGTVGVACTPCANSTDSCLNGLCYAACKEEGVACTTTAECCYGVSCSGTCASAPGGACQTDTGCKQPLTGGAAVCQDNRCCSGTGAACLESSACCNGLTCDNFRCQPY